MTIFYVQIGRRKLYSSKVISSYFLSSSGRENLFERECSAFGRWCNNYFICFINYTVYFYLIVCHMWTWAQILSENSPTTTQLLTAIAFHIAHLTNRLFPSAFTYLQLLVSLVFALLSSTVHWEFIAHQSIKFCCRDQTWRKVLVHRRWINNIKWELT